MYLCVFTYFEWTWIFSCHSLNNYQLKNILLIFSSNDIYIRTYFSNSKAVILYIASKMYLYKTFYVQAFAFSILISVQQHYVSAFSTVSIIYIFFNLSLMMIFICFYKLFAYIIRIELLITNQSNQNNYLFKKCITNE